MRWRSIGLSGMGCGSWRTGGIGWEEMERGGYHSEEVRLRKEEYIMWEFSELCI